MLFKRDGGCQRWLPELYVRGVRQPGAAPNGGGGPGQFIAGTRFTLLMDCVSRRLTKVSRQTILVIEKMGLTRYENPHSNSIQTVSAKMVHPSLSEVRF